MVLSTACATSREGNRGTLCDRSSECAPGLFCVERICTDDLSKLDGGGVPSFDSGMEPVDAADATDAPPADGAEVEPPDTTPPPDTGMPPPDTTPPPDTKPPPDTAPPPDTSVADTAVADTATD